jgi:thiol:disulfide interchange protein DsbD
MVLSALLLLGLVPWPGFKVTRLGLPRLAWGALFLLVAVYFVRGMRGVELDAYTESYLPPRLEQVAASRDDAGVYLDEAAVKALPWNPTLDLALAQARRMRKPLFVDFTGYTCVNCRWMEKKVFAEKTVYDVLRDRFALAQLYTDGGIYAEQNQTVQVERFRTLALPYYVILAPDNTVLAKHAGIMPTPSDFLAWLEQGERQLVSARTAQ